MTETKGCLQWKGGCGKKKNKLGLVELEECGRFLTGRQFPFIATVKRTRRLCLSFKSDLEERSPL